MSETDPSQTDEIPEGQTDPAASVDDGSDDRKKELVALLLLLLKRSRTIYAFIFDIPPDALDGLGSDEEIATAEANRQIDLIDGSTKSRLANEMAEGMAAGEDTAALEARIEAVFQTEAAVVPKVALQTPGVGGQVVVDPALAEVPGVGGAVTLVNDAVVTQTRAELIGDTLVTWLLGTSAVQLAEAAGMDLSWYTMGDLHVRDQHMGMAGQKRQPGKLFQAPNGLCALHPGGFGVAFMDCNCRCHLVPVKRTGDVPAAQTIAASHAARPSTPEGKLEAERVALSKSIATHFEGVFMSQKKAAIAALHTPGKLHALSFDLGSISAMAIELPDVPDHPNKMPFTGILTRIDSPSDKAPEGSGGKRVILTEAAAEKALPSLMGMAIDYTPKLDGHDVKAKIGIITGAEIKHSCIEISGFFYALDFPQEVAKIKAEQDKIGFSFEAASIIVTDLASNPLVISELLFTGAAVLLKDKAAYTTTSIAASADGELEMSDIATITKSLETLAASVAALTTKVEAGSASVLAKVQPHSNALRACADAMAKDGIGMHAKAGHVAVLHSMADKMDSDAAAGKIPHTADSSYYASAAATTIEATADDGKAAAEALAAAVKPLAEQIAAMGTVVTDLKASSAARAAQPERKTIPSTITGLLAKAGVTLPTGEEKLDVNALDASLKAAGIDIGQRMTVKTGLRASGVLA